jgi:hypothetical protein
MRSAKPIAIRKSGCLRIKATGLHSLYSANLGRCLRMRSIHLAEKTP